MVIGQADESLEQRVGADELIETNAQLESTPTSIAQIIKQRIMEGTYKRGEQIPTQTLLGEEFRVPHKIIWNAVKILKEQGYVSTHRSYGTHVTAENKTSLFKYERISDIIRQRIINGEYKPFQILITRQQFAEEFQVNGNIVTKAFRVLRGEGYIVGENSRIYACIPDLTENPLTQLHQIVAYKIRRRIESGEYKPGGRIPSLPDLESDKELGASHVTIVRALGLLKAEGAIKSKKFAGTFVSADYGKPAIQYDNKMQ